MKEEEEETTLSWTSSMTSLSPEHSMFRASGKTSKESTAATRAATTTTTSATQASGDASNNPEETTGPNNSGNHGDYVRLPTGWKASPLLVHSQQQQAVEQDRVSPMDDDDDDDLHSDEPKPLTMQRDKHASKPLLPFRRVATHASVAAKENLSILMLQSTVAETARAGTGADGMHHDQAAAVVAASAALAQKQSPPKPSALLSNSSDWQERFDGHEDQDEEDVPVDIEHEQHEQYQHHQQRAPLVSRPSPIMEENPSTMEDDEDSDQINFPVLEDLSEEEEDEARPLLQTSMGSPKRASSMTNLSNLPSSPTRTEHIVPLASPLRKTRQPRSYSWEHMTPKSYFSPHYSTTRFYELISQRLLKKHYTPLAAATWIGFWALLHVTCANYVLTPMRDAIALQVGVEHMPKLTLASTVLAFCSSVPIGWLFEAPDPNRRRLWKRMGLTRGETQGSSLALFYRCFASILISYAVGFQLIELLRVNKVDDLVVPAVIAKSVGQWWPDLKSLWVMLGQTLYIAFFLVVHLMKLHSLSLMWGVATEAMEYEEVARKRSQMESNKTRLQRLALVGFGGTIGGILGSVLTSSMAHILRLPGLLVVAALLLEITAELSIELGRIMQKHWEEQQLFKSTDNLASLDTSMQRSASLGSMKRVASGNSLNRVKSASELAEQNLANPSSTPTKEAVTVEMNDNTFLQRLMRGVTTILRSRLLMAIFTYNALYASTTVLLSFQRAALVANRKETTTTEADTAFLANINMASSVAIFALQASGLGAYVATSCGPRGTLALMPLIRLAGVLALAWWYQTSNGQPPNLLIFLVVDECTKIMNLAVAKPVRESLWSGLSNEARYEAKPIVDTLANRWGGGSAAFLVSFINKALDMFGVQPGSNGGRVIFGFPPILVLCVIIASWWTAVSADLGHIRSRIDTELKKRQ